jgi:hypothetical protein
MDINKSMESRNRAIPLHVESLNETDPNGKNTLVQMLISRLEPG